MRREKREEMGNNELKRAIPDIPDSIVVVHHDGHKFANYKEVDRIKFPTRHHDLRVARTLHLVHVMDKEKGMFEVLRLSS